MKKVLFFASALAVISMTSCKKEYSCDCTFNVLGTEQTGDSFADYPDTNGSSDKMKKSDAQDACDKDLEDFKVTDSNATCTLNAK